MYVTIKKKIMFDFDKLSINKSRIQCSFTLSSHYNCIKDIHSLYNMSLVLSTKMLRINKLNTKNELISPKTKYVQLYSMWLKVLAHVKKIPI